MEVLDFLPVQSPKWQILDRGNLEDLTIDRSFLIELRNNIFPKLTGLVDLTCFKIYLSAELGQWIIPLLREFLPQKITELISDPLLYFGLPFAHNRNLCSVVI
jgi:hypothetical protein